MIARWRLERSQRWALVLGIALRVLFMVFTPVEGSQDFDLNIYHTSAVELAADGSAWLELEGNQIGYRAPLYFAYLSLFHWLSPVVAYQVSQVANLVLFAVIVLLLARFGREFFSLRCATIAVWVRCLWPSYVAADCLVMSEILFQLLALSAVCLLVSGVRSTPRALALGLLVGLCILTREFASGLSLLVAAAVLLQPAPTRARVGRTLAYALGVTLAIAPWMTRNSVVRGTPFPLALTSGINLHIGNHPQATGVYVMPSDPEHVTPEGLRVGTLEYDRWHRDAAVRYILEHPGDFLRRVVPKVADLVWPRTLNTILRHSDLDQHWPKPLVWAAIGAGTVLGPLLWLLGLTSLIATGWTRWGVATWSLLGYTVLTVSAAFGNPRFADPILLLLILPSAQWLTRPKQLWPELRSRWMLALVTIGLLVALWIAMLLIKLG